jgi:hypothetical protein
MNELPKFGYGDSAFNLRFDANAWSGIAVAVHLIRRCYKGATPQIESLVTAIHQVIVRAPETHRGYDW